MMAQSSRSLAAVEEALNGWVKPKVFGESWDNIGLLVGSGRWPRKEDKIISGILVCNDLKPAVVDEAIGRNANLIIAYHPPIFSGMKSVTYGSWKQELIARCLANDISVYSPHAALDAIAGGLNDAVVDKIKLTDAVKVKPIIPNALFRDSDTGLKYESTRANVASFLRALNLSKLSDIAADINVDYTSGTDVARITFYHAKTPLGQQQIEEIKRAGEQSSVQDLRVPLVVKRGGVLGHYGAGRIVEFENPTTMSTLVNRVKSGLNLDYVQVAFGGKEEVRTVAICVGSGESLFADVQADVYFTGELKHHAILDCTMAGSSAILCNHCSSERHYLPTLASNTRLLTGIDEVFVSETDRSPLSLSN